MSNKDAYWFSHDGNARNDVKCIKLRRELGIEGYGIFWILIEMLREQPGYKIPLSNIEDIAYDLHVSKEKIDAVITRYGLFQIEDEIFFSARLLRSMQQYDTKKNILSNAGKKGNEIRWKSPGDREAIGRKSLLKDIKVYKTINISFDTFWELYDKKKGDKDKLVKKWGSLTDDDREKIIAHIPVYKIEQPDKQYRKNPETYLNNKSWNDETLLKPAQEKTVGFSDENQKFFEDYVRGNS